MHLHTCHANDSFRTCLLNGAARVAPLRIPQHGVSSTTPSATDLQAQIEEDNPVVKSGK